MKFNFLIPFLFFGVLVFAGANSATDNLNMLTAGNSKKWKVKHYLLNEYQLDAFKCLENNAEFEFSIDRTLKKEHTCNPDSQLVILNDTFSVTADELQIGAEKFQIVEITNTYLRIKKTTIVTVTGTEILKIENAEKTAEMEIIFESI
jgi:hypothetical protein